MQQDYADVIDAQTWAFIRRTESFYPPDTAQRNLTEQRSIYNTMCAAFHQGYPAEMIAIDACMAGVPVRHYTPKQVLGPARVLYFHGGGFVVGGLESHDDVCAELSDRTGFALISADYRLCPEHVHPAAFEDCLAVTRTVLTQGPQPVILVGDSAGGTLAAAVALALRGQAQLVGVVLIYPGLGGDMNRGSYLTQAHAPMLSRDDVLFYKDIRQAADHDITASPLAATDLTGLPPVVAFAAECDPLADDAGEFCARITAQGGVARAVLERGLVHGYLRARTEVDRARKSFTRIVDAIAACAT